MGRDPRRFRAEIREEYQSTKYKTIKHMMTYKEQLESQEWKKKRNEILKRDNYHCQHCGKFGTCGEDVYIPLYDLYDVRHYIADEELQKLILHSFFELGIHHENDSASFHRYKSEKIIDEFNCRIATIESKDWLKKHPTWTDILLYKIAESKFNKPQDYILLSEGEELPPIITGIKIPINPYTSICSYSHIKHNDKRTFGLLNVTVNAIHVFLNNYIYDEDYMYIIDSCYFYTNTNKQKLNIPLLDIHHKFYKENHLAWEYDNSNLITLCRDCHEKEHAAHGILLLDENDEPIEVCMCDRCGGTGYLPQYKYFQHGICFKCGGYGYLKL